MPRTEYGGPVRLTPVKARRDAGIRGSASGRCHHGRPRCAPEAAVERSALRVTRGRAEFGRSVALGAAQVCVEHVSQLTLAADRAGQERVEQHGLGLRNTRTAVSAILPDDGVSPQNVGAPWRSAL